MELLVTKPSDEDYPSRTFYLCHSLLLADLAKDIQPTSRYFSFFLAMDARGVEDCDILDLARDLYKKGLACLSAWGPDSQRVHDLFDKVIWAEITNPTDENVVMTMWHSGKPLKEALSFFAHSAFATEDYCQTCTDWIAACVGNPDWENRIRNTLRGLAKQKS